jgi:hypothetical protein
LWTLIDMADLMAPPSQVHQEVPRDQSSQLQPKMPVRHTWVQSSQVYDSCLWLMSTLYLALSNFLKDRKSPKFLDARTWPSWWLGARLDGVDIIHSKIPWNAR